MISPCIAPTIQETQEERTLILYSHKSKRNKKRYKRNLKRVQKSYFSKCVEDKTYNTPQFYDVLNEWYMV
jgi:hypothetical protein